MLEPDADVRGVPPGKVVTSPKGGRPGGVRVLGDFGTIERAGDGEVLFRESEPGRHMYVIVSGAVLLTRKNIRESREVVTKLAELREGEFFGEMALFDEGPRSATATASGDVVLRRISRKELAHAIRSDPDVALAFLDGLSSRLRRTDEALERLVVRELLASEVFEEVAAARYGGRT